MIVNVRPELLRWARERASLTMPELACKIGSSTKPAPLELWERSGEIPLAQLEILAAKTHVPLGFLFLETPPEESLPLPDFRTFTGNAPPRPSPDLVDTIHACIRRQDWYREHLQECGTAPLPFLGRYTAASNPDAVASDIRRTLSWVVEPNASQRRLPTAVGRFATAAEQAGILVMRSGVVGNNTRRRLDLREFRGFALHDPLAPLVFVNANDGPAAQLFTLAHELAHVWVGESALDDVDITTNRPLERFCNRVAAEVLVPWVQLAGEWNGLDNAGEELDRLALHFGVGRTVVLIRAVEAGLIDRETLERHVSILQESSTAVRPVSRGGNFVLTQRSRLGLRFAQAVIRSARAGNTLMRDAYDLLGIRKHETLVRLAAALEAGV